MTADAVSPAPQPLLWHVRRTFAFAVPIAVARAAILILFVVDSVMTGWAGPEELGALGLGIAPQLTLMLVSVGILQSIVVLTAQAIGAGEENRTGAVFRAGLGLAVALGLIVLVLSLFGAHLLRLLGQDPAIIPRAHAVSMAFAVGAPGMLAFVATNVFLEATGRRKVGMAVMLAANVVNVPLNGVLMLGWGGMVEPLGAVGAVGGSSALRTLAFIVCFAFLIRAERRQGDRRGVVAALKGKPIGHGGLLRRMVRIGAPMGLAQGVESAAFAAMVILGGLISTQALAAHQAAITLISFVYMFAIGTAGATSIRVGNAVGRRSEVDIRMAGWAGIAVAGGVALTFSAVFGLAPEAVAGIYGLTGPALAVTAATIATGAMVLPFDAMMGACLGALRGVGDVWVPMLAQVGAFWLGAVPAAALFGIGMELGAPGLMLGILTGVLSSFVLLALRFRAVANRPVRRV